ncbi:MAG: pyridoxamine 5'-phosphate oxidase family protein [Micropruina sp.]
MAQYGHLTTLDAAECRLLLATRNFGRVGWNSASGVQILPVSYGMVDDLIVFRTAAGSPLAQLVHPVEVSFQVDDLDGETSTGWSVLVHGTSGAPVASLPDEMPDPWAPGDRPIVIGILPDHYTGRSIAKL